MISPPKVKANKQLHRFLCPKCSFCHSVTSFNILQCGFFFSEFILLTAFFLLFSIVLIRTQPFHFFLSSFTTLIREQVFLLILCDLIPSLLQGCARDPGCHSTLGEHSHPEPHPQHQSRKLRFWRRLLFSLICEKKHVLIHIWKGKRNDFNYLLEIGIKNLKAKSALQRNSLFVNLTGMCADNQNLPIISFKLVLQSKTIHFNRQ